MSSATVVRVTVFPAAIRRLTGPGSTVHQAMLRVANRVSNNAYNRCPFKTGYLRSTIAVRDGAVIDVVAAAEYAIFVHEGTSRMAARPFLRDALAEEIALI